MQARRRSALCADAYARAVNKPRPPTPNVCGGVEMLTPRENELLCALAEGLPVKIAARRLNMGYQNARTHLTHIYRKLGVTNRIEALAAARRLRLLPDERDEPPRTAQEAMRLAVHYMRLAEKMLEGD